MNRSRHPLLTTLAVAATISLSVIASASGASAAGVATTTHHSSRPTTIRGIVVSDNVARRTLVVALRSGAVRTLRFQSARHVAVGADVSSVASVLGDGTFRATTVHVLRRSRVVHLRATVVTVRGRRLVLSSGGSVFSIQRARVLPRATGSTPSTGDVVNVSADVHRGALDETAIQNVGTTTMIDLQGTLASLSGTSLSINVNDGALTTVVIPASITLPSTIATGDQVEMMVAYANYAFTLVTIVDDHAAASNPTTGVASSGSGQTSNIEIEGVVAATSSTVLTIQPGDNAAALDLSVPATLSLPPVAVGDQVHAVADLVAGVMTLVSVSVQAPEDGQGQPMTTTVTGQVSSVSATQLVVQSSDQGVPVTFVVPSTVDVSNLAIGDRVRASGAVSSGTLTLVSVQLRGGDGSSNGASTTTVTGQVSSVSATQLVVQSSDQGVPVTFVVPSTVDVSNLAIGDRVRASGAVSSGTLTLVSVQLRGGDGSSNGASTTTVTGQVSSVSATQLVVQSSDQGVPVTFVVPSTVDVSNLAIGVRVRASGAVSSGTLTLVSVQLRGGDGSSNGASTTTVTGQVAKVSASSLTLTLPGGSTPLVVAVPSTVDVSGVSVGSQLTVTTTMVAGTPTVVTFQIG